jgi:hypothetical protein
LAATEGADFEAGVKEMPPNGFLVGGVWAEGMAKLGLVDGASAVDAVRLTFANNPPTLLLAPPPNPRAPDDGAEGLMADEIATKK